MINCNDWLQYTRLRFELHRLYKGLYYNLDAMKNLTFYLVNLTKTMLDLPDSEVPSMHSVAKQQGGLLEI